MPLDPRARAVPDQMAAQGLPPLDTLSEAAGRDSAAIGLQIQLGDPRAPEATGQRAGHFAALGSGWDTVPICTLYQGGCRAVDDQLNALSEIPEKLKAEDG